MPPTPVTGPHPTIPTHKDILRQVKMTHLTLQIALIAPCPLQIPIMFAADVSVEPQAARDVVEGVGADGAVGVGGDFLGDGLVGRCYEAVFVPDRAGKEFPYLATDIAEFAAATLCFISLGYWMYGWIGSEVTGMLYGCIHVGARPLFDN